MDILLLAAHDADKSGIIFTAGVDTDEGSDITAMSVLLKHL